MSYPLVALGSGQGSTIEFFCQQARAKKAPFEIKALVTENPRSGLIPLAKRFHLPCHVVLFRDKTFQDWDRELCRILLFYKPRLVMLAGFLKKIGPQVLKNFKIINSHPSLLPEFAGPGMYGLKVHQAVLQAKKKQTGVSIHIVNKDYDKGPLLAQITAPVQRGDTAETLEERVKKKEKVFYFQTILDIAEGKLSLP